jgi:hypothetical protein
MEQIVFIHDITTNVLLEERAKEKVTEHLISTSLSAPL